jgi:hypothetical protein
MWPFNRGWPLNGGPLNRGSTVFDLCFHHIFHAVELVKLQDFITDYRQQMLLYFVPYFGLNPISSQPNFRPTSSLGRGWGGGQVSALIHNNRGHT